jgi:hypothetical protein
MRQGKWAVGAVQMAAFHDPSLTQRNSVINGNNVSIVEHALTVYLQAAIKELTLFGRVSIGLYLAAHGS